MRLIDADELKKAYFNAIEKSSIGEVSIVNLIDNAPTVEDHSRELVQKSLKLGRNVGYFEGKIETKRQQGEWIFDREFTEFGNPYGTYKCSVCGGHSSNKYSFCKDCGASMKPKTCTNCETFGQDCGDCEVGDDD